MSIIDSNGNHMIEYKYSVGAVDPFDWQFYRNARDVNSIRYGRYDCER